MSVFDNYVEKLRKLGDVQQSPEMKNTLMQAAAMIEDLANPVGNNRHYINRFENVEQIRECAKYYIPLLGLQDWRIKFAFKKPSNPNWAGECESICEEKCAKITIDSAPPENDYWFKQPQELVLIHELIHCKIPLHEDGTLSGNIVSTYEHTLVDDWARSIFYARYNLTHDDMYFADDTSDAECGGWDE